METIIARNIAFFRKKMNLTQGELAKLVGIGRANIGHYEKGVTVPQLKTLVNLAKVFNVSTDILLGVEEFSTKGESENLTTTTKIAVKENILISVKDQERYVNGIPLKSPITISLPGINENAKVFEIDEDSMIPIIFPNDLVICSKLSDFEEARRRVPYVIISPITGIIVRYIEREKKDFTLIAEDAINFQSIKIDYSKIKEIWEVNYRLTGQLLHPSHYSKEKNLIERIKRLEDKDR